MRPWRTGPGRRGAPGVHAGRGGLVGAHAGLGVGAHLGLGGGALVEHRAGALTVGEGQRPQRGDHEECAGELDGGHVLGEEQQRDAGDVGDRAAGGLHGLRVRARVGDRVDRVQADGLGVGGGHDHRAEHQDQAQRAERGDPALALDGLQQGVRGVHADEHEHEEEEHHDRARVDHDLHDAQERRLLRDVDDRQAEHDRHQADRRVGRLAGEDQAEGGDHHERRHHPEQDGLPRAHRAGLGEGRGQRARDPGETRGNEQGTHFVAPSVAADAARSAGAAAKSSPATGRTLDRLGSSGRRSRTHATWSSVGPVTAPR